MPARAASRTPDSSRPCRDAHATHRRIRFQLHHLSQSYNPSTNPPHQPLQNPREDRSMRLNRSSAACARSSSGPAVLPATPTRETRAGQRIGARQAIARSASMPFEIADQAAAGSTVLAAVLVGRARRRRIAGRVLRRTVEVMLVENLVQSGVERMRASRGILGRHPHRGLLRVSRRLPIAIGDSVVRELDRVVS